METGNLKALLLQIFPLQSSTVIYMVVIQSMGANVFRHFIQIKSLIVLHILPPLELSIFPIKARKEDIERVPDFYQQTV